LIRLGFFPGRIFQPFGANELIRFGNGNLARGSADFYDVSGAARFFRPDVLIIQDDVLLSRAEISLHLDYDISDDSLSQEFIRCHIEIPVYLLYTTAPMLRNEDNIRIIGQIRVIGNDAEMFLA
jgi:hypothetical protein